MLKKQSEKTLIENGLKFSCTPSDENGKFICGISKPIGIVGNKLHNYGITNLASYDDYGNQVITKTDLPVLALLFESEIWRIDCTEFVPIPGSGDFQKEFKNEESAISYILRYFFEKNEHIDELNKYLKNNSG
ncbi:hypothetical protein [uncultured Psychroserpens sp.]|uniref:hypothetical protein n=1 Tax=uncultured Psychroserpens sp. TaxID=255436 RepID=UPI00261C11D2|nr:hypothetical protein [uncultured Psychroserpens sp.]